MSDNADKTAEQAASFQKIWLESVSKMMQAAFTFTPDSASPELYRQVRGSIFQALARSWDEFLRSPQFLQGTRQWMEAAINFRKLSNDFMARTRREMQATTRDDVDTLMLTVRHMETRLLDRVEQLVDQVRELNARLDAQGAAAPAPAKKSPNGARGAQPARKPSRKPTQITTVR